MCTVGRHGPLTPVRPFTCFIIAALWRQAGREAAGARAVVGDRYLILKKHVPRSNDGAAWLRSDEGRVRSIDLGACVVLWVYVFVGWGGVLECERNRMESILRCDRYDGWIWTGLNFSRPFSTSRRCVSIDASPASLRPINREAESSVLRLRWGCVGFWGRRGHGG